jgi:hypothetical protein
MADNTPSPAPVIDPAEHNKKIAAAQAAQDINGQSTVTGEFGDASAALDALAAKVEAKPVVEPAAPAPTTPDSTAAPDPEAAKAAEKAAAEAAAEAAKAKAAEAAAAAPQVDDIFKDAPQLPAGESPKSAEAFATVKARAIQEIAAREDQIAKLKEQIAQAEAAAKTPSEEQKQKEQELTDHRAWRAKMDVDFDPKFKAFDKTVTDTRDFIYAQLKKSPVVTDDIIEQIKKFGGPDKTDLTKLFGAMNDPVTQRIVESKLAEIAMSQYQKEQAIKEAKTNVQGYMAERQKQFEQAATMHTRATVETLGGLVNQLDWFKEKPATEANAKEHNEFLSTLREQIDTAVKDDSPRMRAVLITGMAQLFNLQRHHAAVKAELEATKKSLEDVTKKWQGVKRASTSRLEESAAPAAGVPPQAPKASEQVNLKTSDALDNIAKGIMETRARANTGA